MPALAETLRVEGLRDLHRAFRLVDPLLAREFRETLKAVAAPIRGDAERLAVSTIPRVTLHWSQMRIGVTQTSVYIAPRQRGVRGNSPRQRPNFAELLLGRAMLPALEANLPRVIHEVDQMLGEIGKAWERV